MNWELNVQAPQDNFEMYNMIGFPEREERTEQKNIWSENGQEFPQINETSNHRFWKLRKIKQDKYQKM